MGGACCAVCRGAEGAHGVGQPRESRAALSRGGRRVGSGERGRQAEPPEDRVRRRRPGPQRGRAGGAVAPVRQADRELASPGPPAGRLALAGTPAIRVKGPVAARVPAVRDTPRPPGARQALGGTGLGAALAAEQRDPLDGGGAARLTGTRSRSTHAPGAVSGTAPAAVRGPLVPLRRVAPRPPGAGATVPGSGGNGLHLEAVAVGFQGGGWSLPVNREGALVRGSLDLVHDPRALVSEGRHQGAGAPGLTHAASGLVLERHGRPRRGWSPRARAAQGVDVLPPRHHRGGIRVGQRQGVTRLAGERRGWQGRGPDPAGGPVQGDHPNPLARARRDGGVGGLGPAARGAPGDPGGRAGAGPQTAARIEEGRGPQQARPLRRLPSR